MKILIGYDGSEGADLVIEGLRRAGLPAQDVEALVVTVAEVWLPPPPRDEVIDDTFLCRFQRASSGRANKPHVWSNKQRLWPSAGLSACAASSRSGRSATRPRAARPRSS
ncbi:MAG TPA: hypothetical protein VM911_05900 [Pyrinomonadaceae bacterium]|nr:hypothetical protein [Pyrinomonadaceae bacterium]